ncbi:hypothetical protein ScPMuIL_009451 [Solemya velum]
MSDDKPSCSRCGISYQHHLIVRCKRSVPGGLRLCDVCHKRLHRRCRQAEPEPIQSHILCTYCLLREATIICPQCIISKDKEAFHQFCTVCNDTIHEDQLSTHLDHIKPLPR